MSIQRTQDEILADFLYWTEVDGSTLPDLDGCEPDDYIQNQYENIVAEAVKAGLIVEDLENNGRHEGWDRMGRALDRLAYDRSKAAVDAARRELDTEDATRTTLTPAQKSALTRRQNTRLARSVWPAVRALVNEAR